VNANERLREIIHGGPYDPFQWILLVHMAALADNAGLLDRPDRALMSDWISRSEHQVTVSLKGLKQMGWVTMTDDQRYDISRNLRQGSRARADITDRARY
jgi:hypothetical protein